MPQGSDRGDNAVDPVEATDEDWATEYLDMDMAVKVVDGIDEAIRVGTRILALTPHPGRLAATFDVPPESRIRGTAGFTGL